MGPPSGAGTLGTAAYTNVPTKPNNRTNALSERFIVFLLGFTETPLDWKVCAAALYTDAQVSSSQQVTTYLLSAV